MTRFRISGIDPADIQPGSPLHAHTEACEMGLLYGPWKDCGCRERIEAARAEARTDTTGEPQ